MHELLTKVKERINAVEERVSAKRQKARKRGRKDRKRGGITFEPIHGIWRVTSNSVYVRLLCVLFRELFRHCLEIEKEYQRILDRDCTYINIIIEYDSGY